MRDLVRRIGRRRAGDKPPRYGLAVRSAHLAGSHFLGDLAHMYLADGEAPSRLGEPMPTGRKLPLPEETFAQLKR